jgi:CheY-like chemotaxis protein
MMRTANDGLEGLDKLSRRRFDAIFLDVVMSFMNGLEVLQAIRSCPEICSLPKVERFAGKLFFFVPRNGPRLALCP